MLKPCTCDAKGISCGGNNAFNLKRIFEDIDQKLDKKDKHFKEFYLNKTAIEEIEENTFFEVTFDEICTRLRNSGNGFSNILYPLTLINSNEIFHK
jgi:hypothetical protein